MSGGSMDYLCFKVEDANFTLDTPLRKAFMAHLKLVGKALHDIEWVDSMDCSPGSENKAIKKCLQKGAALREATKDAKEAMKNLKEQIQEAQNGNETTD